MKLAIYHNQPSGGARRSLYELARRLASSHRLDVFTLETADESFLRSADFAANLRVFPFRPRRLARFGSYINDLRRMLDLRDLERVSRQVAAFIDAQGFDVVLVDACRFVQAPSVLQHLNTPTVYYCHEPPRRFIDSRCRPSAAPLSYYARSRLWLHWPATKLLDAYVARLDRNNVQQATRVLTNSSFTRENIRTYYARDAVVCRLGVDANRFRPNGQKRSPSYVLSVGALEPHKGFDFVVRSLACIPPANRPPLLVVGNTDEAGVGRYLLNLAADLGVQLTVRVRITDDELVAAYQDASAFLYAPYGEPFGLAVLEAMASGLPVVAVAEGGPVESVIDGRNGYLVPRQVGAFSHALRRVLADEGLRSSMSQEARDGAKENWSWDAAAGRVEEHLQAVSKEYQR